MLRALIIASPLFLALTPAAIPHESWIHHGRYRSPTDGTLCCGAQDCAVIPAESVARTPEGYRLAGGEVIPFAEALASEDGHFHRCHRPDGSRRCFFAPPAGA